MKHYATHIDVKDLSLLDAGLPVELSVRGLGPVREVEPLHERARPLPLAPVADERGLGEALADGLAEVGARLEASQLDLSAHYRVHVLCHGISPLFWFSPSAKEHPLPGLGREADMIPNPARLMEVNATPLPGEGGWENTPPSIPTPVSSTQRKYHFAYTSGNGDTPRMWSYHT